MTLLAVNTGSSSVRLAAFSPDTAPRLLADAHYPLAGAGPAARLRAFATEHGIDDIEIVGHRVVHGGDKLTHPCAIDAGVEAEIERAAAFAPLHNPVALSWIRACRTFLGGDILQVAVFDTGFYADLPEVAATYALPRALTRKHRIRRYGFHGIAHGAMWARWCARRPTMRDRGKAVSLQLGAGCSITATAGGRAIDTSMGFSPLEGLVMATRCGDLDPGIVTFLLRAQAFAPEQMEHLLNYESGLRGLAGSGDMRELLASGDAAARLAIDVYCYRARKYIGAYLAALGGVDAVLFGGGVGEHEPDVRARILAGLEPLGITLDDRTNRAAIRTESLISRDDGGVEAWVIPVNEVEAIARAAMAVAETSDSKERES